MIIGSVIMSSIKKERFSDRDRYIEPIHPENTDIVFRANCVADLNRINDLRGLIIHMDRLENISLSIIYDGVEIAKYEV